MKNSVKANTEDEERVKREEFAHEIEKKLVFTNRQIFWCEHPELSRAECNRQYCELFPELPYGIDRSKMRLKPCFTDFKSYIAYVGKALNDYDPIDPNAFLRSLKIAIERSYSFLEERPKF